MAHLDAATFVGFAMFSTWSYSSTQKVMEPGPHEPLVVGTAVY